MIEILNNRQRAPKDIELSGNSFLHIANDNFILKQTSGV